MSDWSDTILVAIGVGDDRSVTPLVSASAVGLEVVTAVGVKVGDEVQLQIRCGGPRRVRFATQGRVESRTQDNVGFRVRFAYLTPDSDDLQALAGLARERSLFADDSRSGTADDEIETILFDLHTAEAASEAVDQLLAGSLMVATASPPAVNVQVLLRLSPAEGSPLWLSGRVVYHGLVAPGRHGAGIALDPVPDALRRELKHLRERACHGRAT